VFLRAPCFIALILALFACACTAGSKSDSACTGTKAELRDAGTLTVATDVGFAPFAFRDPAGKPVGFEIDLAHALAREMKLHILVLNRGTSELITGLLAHRHDLALSAMRETPELSDETCLSSSYLDANLGIVVPNPDPHEIGGVSDLKGQTVAVLERSRAEAWALDHLKRSTVASLPTTDDVLEALVQKKADAVVDELAVARFAAKESRSFKVATKIETEERFVTAGAPDNGGLIERVNAALSKLESNGTLPKLRRKWFGAS
jgi:polar amino acid transport system substrate-binding protein